MASVDTTLIKNCDYGECMANNSRMHGEFEQSLKVSAHVKRKTHQHDCPRDCRRRVPRRVPNRARARIGVFCT